MKILGFGQDGRGIPGASSSSDRLLELESVPAIVMEAGLSRILKHVQSSGGIAFISAYRERPELGDEDKLRANARDDKNLRAEVLDMGYGYIKLLGGWVYTDPATGERQEAVEPSIGIPGMDAETAHEVGNAFGQMAVLWAGSDQSVLYYQDGRKEPKRGSLTTQRVQEYFSVIGRSRYQQARGLRWSLESFRYQPQGAADQLGWVRELEDVAVK